MIGWRLAILSNGLPSMLQAAIANAGTIDRLDPVASVHDIGI
jgi:hypothetical protein